ncbi:MAG: Dihydrodipicolinate synthase/N-acetylneuraminate lyase [Verrucomicrobia bacterium]|jgi:dihydrodipicolinate synthase/N-acetylneuraminate lyase|nr:MAG: Dihydrodipicolinate synthase/N-acetylneuraminate lyase [Verrucomicrobiota bacterium]
MNAAPVHSEILTRSVIALPPLARTPDRQLSTEQNRRLVRSLEAGGIRILLYGTNALVQHLRPSEYAPLLGMLAEIAGPETTVIPAIGPSHGLMMEQLEVLRGTPFPTVQILPPADPEAVTATGFERAVGEITDSLGRPVVLSVNDSCVLTPPILRRLVAAGQVSFILYQVSREDPANDPLLRELVDTVDPRSVVSGLGEQVTIPHVREFGVGTFASGCACVAARLSQCLLEAMQRGEWGEAEEIRGIFRPLEELRRKQSPVSVLHEALTFAGIAEMGPMPAMLTPVNERYLSRVREAAQSLLAGE